MSLPLVLASLLVAAVPSADTPCAPIAGWEQLLADEQVRWIVVGEMHGNNEAPEIFADAICLTARSRPVVVALEVPSTEQPAIDRFMASDGADEARRAFLQSPMWNMPMHDGRSSQAFFRLFETLRQMRSAGQVVSVVAFQPVRFDAPPSPAEYEQAMAELVHSAARPGATVLALVGNLHAMRTEVPWGSRYLPMAGYLPSESTVTLNAQGEGGETWTCRGQPAVCGPHAEPAPRQAHPRAVELRSDGQAAYSGALYLGVTTTASPPQVNAVLAAD